MTMLPGVLGSYQYGVVELVPPMHLPIVIAVLALLSLISHIPGAIMIGFFLAIFPGFVLMASDTFLAYSLAISAPLVFRAAYPRQSASTLMAIALASVTLVAVVPGLLSKYTFNSFAKQHAADDIIVPPSIEPRTFQVPPEGSVSRTRGLAQLQCGPLCQKLLFNASVEAVYIQSLATWRFSLENGAYCPQTASKILDEFASRKKCIREVEVDDLRPDVVIRFKSRNIRIPKANQKCSASSFALWTAKDAYTLEIDERVHGLLSPAERHTGISGQIIPVPLFILPIGCNESAVPRLAVWDSTSQAEELARILLRRYRIDIDRPSK